MEIVELEMQLDRSEKVAANSKKYAEQQRYKKNWHEWFVWYPIQVPAYSGHWVWLETIERKWIHRVEFSDTGGVFGGSTMFDYSHWEYFLIK